MFHNPSALRLGRKAPSNDPRTLKLAKYAPNLPPAPPMKNWSALASDWGMMANDALGDCTIASAGHIVLLDTAARGAPIHIPDDQIIAAYSGACGYDPRDP